MIAEKDDSGGESLFIDQPVLVTNRLILRAPRDSDIPALVQLADNRHVAQMLARMPHPYGEAEARAFIAMSQLRRPGAGYALTLAGTGTFVGCAGLNVKDRGLELGYWIGEPYWKRGFATEAAHALEEWGRAWCDAVSQAFLGAYLAEADGASWIPEDPEGLRVLLDTSLLEKAVYELTYELNNRPTWVPVALMGITDLVGSGAAAQT